MSGYVRKLCHSGRGIKFAMPRQVAEAMGWRVGDYIAIVLNPDDTVSLTHVKLPAPRDARRTPATPQDRTA